MKTTKSTRHYFKFEEWLVPKVQSGKKRRTIRAKRKRVPKAGETAVLQRWSGKPYCSPVETLGEYPLVKVVPITITQRAGDFRTLPASILITVDTVNLTTNEGLNLAIMDGFDSLESFAEFFRSRLPFDGHLYEWDTTPQQNENI